MELVDVYPALHAMLHVAPLAKVPLQVPVPPFATEKLVGMVQPVKLESLVLALVLALESMHIASLPYNIPR